MYIFDLLDHGYMSFKGRPNVLLFNEVIGENLIELDVLIQNLPERLCYLL